MLLYLGFYYYLLTTVTSEAAPGVACRSDTIWINKKIYLRLKWTVDYNKPIFIQIIWKYVENNMTLMYF